MIGKYSIIFVFLAYFITWLMWIPAFVLASMHDFKLPLIDGLNEFFVEGVSSDTHLLVILLFVFAVYGPFIAGFVSSFLENGKKGVSQLFFSLLNFDFKLKWLFFIFGFVFIIYFVAGLVSGVMFGGGIITFAYPLVFFIPIFLYHIFSSGLEEVGWRGYLLPKMLERNTAERSAWIIGLVWGVWHWPLLIYLYLDYGLQIIISVLAGNVMALIGMTFIYVWIYQNTKNIFLLILFHALLNTLPLFIIGQANEFAFFIPIVLTWVMAIWLTKKYGSNLIMSEKSRLI